MKRLAIVLIAIFLTWISPFAQTSSDNDRDLSLAELAEQEQERRSQIKQDVPLITNKDLATMQRARVSQARSTGAAKELPSPEEKPSTDETPESLDEAEEEIDWSQTFSEATLAYRTAVNNHLVLQLRFNNLRNAFFNEDDGTTQSLIQAQMQETTEKLEQNTQAIKESHQRITDLKQAAERAGLTPGEIRELTGELPEEPESILSTTTPTP